MLSKRKHLGISCDGEKIKPPSQRDVWNRRHLWWIQTMKNAEGWRMKADGRSKKAERTLSASRQVLFYYTRFRENVQVPYAPSSLDQIMSNTGSASG